MEKNDSLVSLGEFTLPGEWFPYNHSLRGLVCPTKTRTVAELLRYPPRWGLPILVEETHPATVLVAGFATEGLPGRLERVSRGDGLGP